MGLLVKCFTFYCALFAPAAQRPLLLHDESLLAITWAGLARQDKVLLGAVGRLEAEARGHLTTGPFTVTTTAMTPPSGDKKDYISIGVC